MITPGHRELSQQEVDLIKTIRHHGENLRVLCETADALDYTDKRWAAIGRTHFQEGIMCLVRAITKPEVF